ncbi:MAG: response regulator [Candidatus Nealsonbacteria bacterium]|nr:response regulator [Candidatus Nealsonbacteria bacterium]
MPKILIIEDEKPDLILLDILLPKENGIFFLKKWREKEEFSLTPIIAFSNYDDQETKKEAFQFGVKTYLIKTSLTPKELVEIIKNYLK